MSKSTVLMPRRILRSPLVSPMAKVLYLTLRSYAIEADHCSPKMSDLCCVTGCTAKPINKAIDELVDHKLIERKQVGLGKPNRYTILDITPDLKKKFPLISDGWTPEQKEVFGHFINGRKILNS